MGTGREGRGKEGRGGKGKEGEEGEPPHFYNEVYATGQTDRQTDRQTEISSPYRGCITCSAVKMLLNVQCDTF